MKLHTMKPAEGATFTRKRVGRGPGSGLGKTSGKGQKVKKQEAVKEKSRQRSREDNSHFIDVYQKEVSLTLNSKQNML